MTMRGFLFMSLSYDLSELDHYLSVTEEYLVWARADFEEKSQEALKKMPLEELDDFGEDWGELSWRYSQVFPRLLRRSFLVTAVSVFEYNMGQMCKQLEREKKLPIGLSDLKGDLAERWGKFLKLAQIPVSFTATTWQELTNISMVRNCIMHNDGLFEGFPQGPQLRAYAEQNSMVSTDTLQEEIAPTREFCEKVIRTMKDFMQEFHDACRSDSNPQPSG